MTGGAATPGVELVVCLPPGQAAAGERVATYVSELAADLRIGPPRLRVETAAAAALSIGGGAIRLPRSLSRAAAEPAAELTARIAAAIFRERWRLLEPALHRAETSSRPALQAAAGLGLAADDLATLARASDEDIAWIVAERYPPSVGLHVAPEDGRLPDEVRQGVISMAGEMTGLPLPEAACVADRGLAAGQIRLRLRAVRTPPAPAADGFVTLLTQHAAMLLDAGVVMRLLLRAGSATTGLLPTVLRASPAPALAAALRPLLAAGFGLPEAPALVAALLASPLATPVPSAWRMALSGTVTLPETTLAARLRAAIVPGALLRRAGGVGQTASYWLLTPAGFDRLPPGDDARRDALVPLALPAARASAVLLVPDRQGAYLRGLLAEDLPSLAIVEAGEWPSGLTGRPRAELKL